MVPKSQVSCSNVIIGSLPFPSGLSAVDEDSIRFVSEELAPLPHENKMEVKTNTKKEILVFIDFIF
jgi:hypothetical protein